MGNYYYEQMKDKWFILFFIIILEQNYTEDFLSLCMPLHLKNSHWFLKIQENSDFYLRPVPIYSRKNKDYDICLGHLTNIIVFQIYAWCGGGCWVYNSEKRSHDPPEGIEFTQ